METVDSLEKFIEDGRLETLHEISREKLGGNTYKEDMAKSQLAVYTSIQAHMNFLKSPSCQGTRKVTQIAPNDSRISGEA